MIDSSRVAWTIASEESTAIAAVQRGTDEAMSSLKGEKDIGVVLRNAFPIASWRVITHSQSSPRTQEAALDFLSKLDSIRVRVADDPTQEFMEVKSTAQGLHSFTVWNH